MAKKQHRITNQEREFIRAHCLTMSDESLANKLDRDVKTIVRARKNIGVYKNRGGKLTTETLSGGSISPSQKLTEEERKEFWKTEFANSLYYGTLKQQLVKEELDFYLEEWASLCVQFEDVIATEKRQIDELIKAEIMGNRILRNIKLTEDEIELLQKEVNDIRQKYDMENDEQAQERDNRLIELIQRMMSQSNAMSMDYQKNVDIKNKLLDGLNSRRRDRVDQFKRAGTTFMGIVSAFRDKELRDRHGKHMELVRIAKNKKENELHKVAKFPDGSRDCILMDENSEAVKKDIVLLRNSGSEICNHYMYENNKKIILIEDDIRRVQFFQTIFKNNQLDVCSNCDKAIKKLNEDKYNLICLDYDLGIGQKGENVADYIVANNLKSDILIHSMNPEGVSRLELILTGKNYQIFPFEDMVKNLGETNENSADNGQGESSKNDVDQG